LFNDDLISFFYYNEMTMAHSQFVKQLWISCGIILASILILTGAIYYFISDLSTQAGVIVDDRAALQNRFNAVTDFAGLENALPEATQYQLAMDQLLPDQYGLVTFEQWLARIGSQYDVTTDAGFQNSIVAPEGATVGTAGFSFDAEGSPANLISFLDDISTKSSGFLLTLSSFEFTSDGTNAKVTGQGMVFFR
jgi:hypothetical protein